MLHYNSVESNIKQSEDSNFLKDIKSELIHKIR